MKKFFTLFFMFFIGVMIVNANSNTLEDVALKMKETSLYKFFADNGDGIDIVTTDNNMIISSEGEQIIKFDYADNIISYKFSGDKNNESDLIEVAFFDTLWIMDVIYAVGMLNGYTEEEVGNWLDAIELTDVSFEENGMESTTYDYEFNDEDSSASGTIIDTFRIDINNFKFDKVEVDDTETEKDVLPTIEIVTVGTDSITISVTSDEYSDDDFCYFERSEDGVNYDFYIGTNCNSEYVDDELEAGKMYYYRTVSHSGETGEALSATTKIASTNNNNNNVTNNTNNSNSVDNNGNITSNPQTGINILSFMVIVILFASAGFLLYYAKKYSEEFY